MKRLVVSVLMLSVMSIVQAELVDNFESYNVGLLGNQAPWMGITWSTTGCATVGEEAGGNQYGAYFGATNGARGATRSVADNMIVNDSTATLFVQAYAESTNEDGSFGLSDVAPSATADWGKFEVQMAFIKGNFAVRAPSGAVTVCPITSQTWYNIWAVIDNATDTYDVYMTTSGDATGLAPVIADVVFRNSGTAPQANALTTFLLLNNTNGTAVRMDNIAITEGVDLTVVPEPATMLLLGLGGLLFARKR